MSLGGGRGCYAGQPLSFACSRCRKSRVYRDSRGNLTGQGFEWEPTGRIKPIGSSRPGSNVTGRRGLRLYEYRCLHCGHVGWSSHTSVERRWNAQFELRCPHDGGKCHHKCMGHGGNDCWRQEQRMALTKPWAGFPKKGTRPVVTKKK